MKCRPLDFVYRGGREELGGGVGDQTFFFGDHFAIESGAFSKKMSSKPCSL